jgi:hypothetical protein
VQEIKLQPFNQEVLQKILTSHQEIIMQTLVVNLPSRETPYNAKNLFLQQMRIT